MGIFYKDCGCYFCSVNGGFYHFCSPEHEAEFAKTHPPATPIVPPCAKCGNDAAMHSDNYYGHAYMTEDPNEIKFGECSVPGCNAPCYPAACEHQPQLLTRMTDIQLKFVEYLNARKTAEELRSLINDRAKNIVLLWHPNPIEYKLKIVIDDVIDGNEKSNDYMTTIIWSTNTYPKVLNYLDVPHNLFVWGSDRFLIDWFKKKAAERHRNMTMTTDIGKSYWETED